MARKFGDPDNFDFERYGTGEIPFSNHPLRDALARLFPAEQQRQDEAIEGYRASLLRMGMDPAVFEALCAPSQPPQPSNSSFIRYKEENYNFKEMLLDKDQSKYIKKTRYNPETGLEEPY